MAECESTPAGFPDTLLVQSAQLLWTQNPRPMGPEFAPIGKTLPGFIADLRRCVAAPPTTPSTAYVNPPTMSLAEFSQITSGMSYEHVVAIVGGAGTIQAQSDLDGISTVIYGWTGEGSIGANATVEFQNDREITKAQAGLE